MVAVSNATSRDLRLLFTAILQRHQHVLHRLVFSRLIGNAVLQYRHPELRVVEPFPRKVELQKTHLEGFGDRQRDYLAAIFLFAFHEFDPSSGFICDTYGERSPSMLGHDLVKSLIRLDELQAIFRN